MVRGALAFVVSLWSRRRVLPTDLGGEWDGRPCDLESGESTEERDEPEHAMEGQGEHAQDRHDEQQEHPTSDKENHSEEASLKEQARETFVNRFFTIRGNVFLN